MKVPEILFSEVFRAAPALFSLSSMPDGRYIDVNEEFVRVLEFERNEIIDHTGLELGVWETPSDRELLILQLLEHRKVRNFETSFKSKYGNTISGLVSAEIIEINGNECLLTLTRDVTELRKAEEERDRLALIVESSVDAVVGMTLEGSITYWNRGAEKIYGFSPQEVEGKHISLLAPTDRTEETQQILGKVKLNETVENLETTRVRKDGRFIAVSMTISPIIDRNGRIIGGSTIARDITDHKRAEEEVERLNVALATRAAELETANKDLEAFNYTVAHDLRQPLNLISTCCQAMKILCGDQLQPECKGYLQMVYDGILRMNQLIGALLNFSRLGRIELRRENIDISATAREVATTLQLTEPKRLVDLRIADGLVAFADPELLRVVLANLLGNAWKYTSKRELAVIEFAAIEVDCKQAYFVRDNGVGFAKADADKLFVPFQRLPGSEGYKGFGIGLATVERIIQRHGGKIWAEGEPDNGTCIYFTLS